MMKRREMTEVIYKIVIDAVQNAMDNDPNFPIPKGTAIANAIHFKNMPFTEPNGVPYYSVEVDVVDQEQIGFGGPNGNLFQTNGELIVECNTPINTNMEDNYRMAGVIADRVRGQHFSGITFFEAYDTHTDRDDSWEITTMTANFEYDEVSG